MKIHNYYYNQQVLHINIYLGCQSTTTNPEKHSKAKLKILNVILFKKILFFQLHSSDLLCGQNYNFQSLETLKGLRQIRFKDIIGRNYNSIQNNMNHNKWLPDLYLGLASSHSSDGTLARIHDSYTQQR